MVPSHIHTAKSRSLLIFGTDESRSSQIMHWIHAFSSLLLHLPVHGLCSRGWWWLCSRRLLTGVDLYYTILATLGEDSTLLLNFQYLIITSYFLKSGTGRSDLCILVWACVWPAHPHKLKVGMGLLAVQEAVQLSEKDMLWLLYFES